MAYSFRAFIDESGDEGWSLQAGSSPWFVVAAVVVRASNEPESVRAMREFRALIRPTGNCSQLHFNKLEHRDRLAWAQAVAKCPIRVIAVLIDKRQLDPKDYPPRLMRLYRYSTKLLIERISWLCEERLDADGGDGTAQVVFSHRRSMSYEDLRAYWRRLKDDPSEGSGVRWDRIAIDAMTSQQHAQMEALQMADCVASSLYSALVPDRFGNAEPRYWNALQRCFYQSLKGKTLGYGLKFWPKFEQLRPSNPVLEVFDGLK